MDRVEAEINRVKSRPLDHLLKIAMHTDADKSQENDTRQDNYSPTINDQDAGPGDENGRITTAQDEIHPAAHNQEYGAGPIIKIHNL